VTGQEPLRVLIACDHIDFEGALHGGGRQLIELTRALLAGGRVTPTVCVLRAATALGRELQAEGLPFEFFGSAPYSPAPLARFVRTIRRDRIEVLHLTDFASSTWGRLAGIATRTPSIVQIITHHSVHTPRGYPKPVELAYRALAPATAKALAISGSVAEFARARMGFTEEQTEVLYSPLPEHSFVAPSAERVAEVRREHGIAPGAPVVGAVSRFFPVKGIRYLIDAFPAVLRQRPDARMLLVGRGPEDHALRSQAASLGIADRVIFAGFQRDSAAYAGSFDVAVVPSLVEGFGLVAVEAMALGVPVVASRVDGLVEVITDERSGLLVPPADSAAIAAAVLRLLAEPELRRRVADGGRAESTRFALDRYTNRLTDLYQELAARP
jgi:glycosyltransferase involved in cell wall biosynthesis